MAKQLYEVGAIIQAGANSLEVAAVSYSEADGEKVNFSYVLRSHADMEQERAEVAAREAEAEAVEDEENGI